MFTLRSVVAALLICLLSSRGTVSGQTGKAGRDVPAPYLTTRDEVGHELVKTEEFIVPIGTTIPIKGLEFPGPECVLTFDQQRILRQVFNSLEEITENTVNDPDLKRVAEHKKMKFEIRGYSNSGATERERRALSENCANIVMFTLTRTGTPASRLQAKAMGSRKSSARRKSVLSPTGRLWVEFVRTQ